LHTASDQKTGGVEGLGTRLPLPSYPFLPTGSLTGRNGVGVRAYFAIRFPQPPIAFGTWEGEELNWHSREAAGSSCGAFVGVYVQLARY